MMLMKAEQAALGIIIAASATGEAVTGDGTSGDDEGTSGAKVDNFIKNNVDPNFQKNVKKAFTSDVKVTVLPEDKIS